MGGGDSFEKLCTAYVDIYPTLSLDHIVRNSVALAVSNESHTRNDVPYSKAGRYHNIRSIRCTYSYTLSIYITQEGERQT